MIVEITHRPIRAGIHTPHYVLIHSDMERLKEQMRISKQLSGEYKFIYRTQFDGNILYDIVDVPDTDGDVWEEFKKARMTEAALNGVSEFRQWYFNYLEKNYITTWNIKEMK